MGIRPDAGARERKRIMSENQKEGLWATLKKPSAKYSLFVLLAVGFVSGIIFWGGFNTAM